MRNLGGRFRNLNSLLLVVGLVTVRAEPIGAVGLQEELSTACAKIRPALVRVVAHRAPDTSGNEPDSRGTGFVVQADGVILTSWTLVQNAREIEITSTDSRRWPARVIGRDERTDVAALKISAAGLPVATWMDAARFHPGIWTIGCGVDAAGSFFSTFGHVSSEPGTDGTFLADVALPPGCLGGPMLASDGSVLGMAIRPREEENGLGCGVNAQVLRQVGAQLILAGRVPRAWIGVRLAETADLEQARLFGVTSQGALIKELAPDTPSSEAGLKPFDLITAIDGESVGGAKDVQRIIGGKGIGRTVHVTCLREGKALEISVRTRETPDAVANFRAPRTPLGHRTFEMLGLKLTHALQVEAVRENSSAQAAGLRVGDQLLELSETKIRSRPEADALLQNADLQKGLMVVLQRQGRKTFAMLRE